MRRVEYPNVRVNNLGGGYTSKTWYRMDLIRGEVRAGCDGACICGGHVSGDEIKGVPTSHLCDARCISATGSICECSCGGKNHGGAYDVDLAESQESFAWA